MNFGARMLKTGIAVTLALYVSSWLDLKPPVIAAIAAIFAMQPSIYRSFRYFLDQIQTNTLGAILALLGGMVFSNDPIAVGLMCIVVIMICLRLKMGDTIGLTLVTVISVMEVSGMGQGQWQFALNRFTLSIIGIVSAFLINVLIAPPKPLEQFKAQIESTFTKMSLLLRTAVSDEIKEAVFREEKRSLDGAIQSLSDKYNLMEEEMGKLNRPSMTTQRHLVVDKQMVTALRKGMDVLTAIEQHYFQAERTKEIDEYFDSHLEKLIKFHEHILLKSDNKIKHNGSEAAEVEAANDKFLDTMIERYQENFGGVLRLSIVAAVMYDYGYQLERLHRLVDHVNGSSNRDKDHPKEDSGKRLHEELQSDSEARSSRARRSFPTWPWK
ncbi:FUSC family protein [Paenibacillus campi]|uniref:FUSC family protein n=1 Tax=Paenibacillus campi TaxID=3106031 RepID=UPI002AFFEED9|nr:MULTISPECIES: aromatic acid exporter family protein [unclassified Paenibacillus]